MAFARSATGCYACKRKHKKCDETKPHCLRCQKSRTECPGYMYVDHPNKSNNNIRTLPGPRTRVSQSRATTREGTQLAHTEELHVHLQNQLPPDYDLVTYGVPGSSMEENGGTLPESIDVSDQRPFSVPNQRPSIDFSAEHRLVTDTANPNATLTPPTASMAMTSGQASLLEALFSLGQPPNMDLPPQRAQSITDPVSSLSRWLPSDTKRYDNSTMHEDEGMAGVVDIVYRELLPDRTAKSNALPFVLQAYAAWINRLALEPLKLTGTARDLVFSHFRDGEHSRWIIILLANIGERLGSVGPEASRPNHMLSTLLSTLQSAMKRCLNGVKSDTKPERAELIKALESATETLLIHFFVSRYGDAIVLMREAAPVFRQLCPDPPDAPIDLHSLLQHSLGCLRRFAHADILLSVILDIPTIFPYNATITTEQHPDLSESVAVIHSEGVLQWLHGTPNPIILLLARMRSMRQDGLTPHGEIIASLEQEIRELQPFDRSSSEPFLAVMRSVVQECWRQATYVYLYMAVCGDPSGTPRVKEAFKRYMKLLSGTTPGRLPDEFLIMSLTLIAPAAQRKRDREVIRQRFLGLYALGKAPYGICIIDDYWARADAEGRETIWADVAASRKRVTGV